MALYRHYKGPFYKTLGVAKHSETQEEFMVYETLYDSPGGRLWVRPRAMFEGHLELDGKSTLRFAPFRPEILQIDHAKAEDLKCLAPLAHKLFKWHEKELMNTFENHSRFFLLTAKIDGNLVGFKVGYELDRSKFHSWLGGVDPDYRRFGVATLLMEEQHAWAKASGYRFIQTKTKNEFRNMLRLNLKHGFEISGLETSASNGEMKIVLRKKLTD